MYFIDVFYDMVFNLFVDFRDKVVEVGGFVVINIVCVLL